MNSKKHFISSRAPFSERGFSLVELIATIAIVSILAAVAIARTSSTHQQRQRAAARRVASEFNFIRNLAMASGRSTWAKVYPGNEFIEYSQTALAATPLASSAVAITDPATGRPMVTTLNSSTGDFNTSGVAIGTFLGSTSTAYVGFNWQGRPTTDTNTLLTSDASLTITAATSSVSYTTITLAVSSRDGAITLTMP